MTLHAVARGRVWTGTEAAARGLVDELGGMDLAVRLAQQRLVAAGAVESEAKAAQMPALAFPRSGAAETLKTLFKPAGDDDAEKGGGLLAPLAAALGGGGGGALGLAAAAEGVLGRSVAAELEMLTGGGSDTPPLLAYCPVAARSGGY